MTVAHIYTVAFEGVEAREVDVQVHIADLAGDESVGRGHIAEAISYRRLAHAQ